MAKKLPCKVCGELRWPSVRNGERLPVTCRSCREAAPLVHGKVSTYSRHGCRCDECRAVWNERSRTYNTRARARRGRMVRTCVICDAEFNPRSNQTTCSTDCRLAHLGRLGSHKSRADHYGVAYEHIDPALIFERDAWTCGICSEPVDATLAFPAPLSATLDHVVPMARGGSHVPANVQLAHFRCNTSKGARVLEEAAC